MLRRQGMIGWFMLALILALPLTLWGADGRMQEPKTPIARLEVQPARVDWLLHVDYESLILTVAGPEELYIHREFGAGETPVFSSLDAPNGNLPDGDYAYELRAVPRPGLTKDSATGESGPPARPLVQSGHLRVQGGSFVDRIPIPPRSRPESINPPAGPSTKVVQGKTCIGSGCGVGDDNVESLKLKATLDTRLTFENSGCCHPSTRSWALQANDVANTTGDFLIRDLTAGTIPFRIGSGGTGSPDNSFTIFFNGNIGLGTSTPGAKLHLFASATGDVFASAGPDPVSGPAFNFGYGGASFGRGAAFLNVRPDASATAPNPSLRFATANVERMIITNAGNVGIGTSAPATKLHVFGSETADVPIGLGPSPVGATAFNVGYGGLSFGRGAGFLNSKDSGATAPNPSIRFLINTSEKMIIDNEGFIGLGVANPSSPIHHSSGAILTAGGSWQNGSSRDIKQDIVELAADEAMETLHSLDPIKFSYKVDPKERHVGFIAEDVPDLVASPDRKSLSTMDLVAVLTKVVQKQQKTIDELAAKVAELEKKAQ